LRIAGRMDRIDQTGPSTFEVLDYKTGGFWKNKWNGVFAGGTRLQHALYGVAAVELLKTRFKKPRVTAGVYYFSSHKGRRERISIPSPSRAKVAAVMGDLRDVILAGQFTRTTDEGNCRFCDYSAVCGGSSVLRLQRGVRREREPAGGREESRRAVPGVREAPGR
jgi:ATP-dependent helicase/nuclease subunit B